MRSLNRIRRISTAATRIFFLRFDEKRKNNVRRLRFPLLKASGWIKFSVDLKIENSLNSWKIFSGDFLFICK